MLIWNLFFVVKVLLWWDDRMSFLPLWNIGLFALALGASVLTHRSRVLGGLMHLVVVLPLAIALSLQELGLVLTTALWAQIQNLLGFSQEYLLELLGRTFPPEMLWTGVALLAALQILNRYFRLGTWIFALLVTVGVTSEMQRLEQIETEQLAQQMATNARNQGREGTFEAERLALAPEQFDELKRIFEERGRVAESLNANTPDGFLNAFYREQEQWVNNTYSPLTTPDFDVIILHVCSLAWADLKQSMQSRHPVIDDADLLFSNFNTATSYSGPAVIRLMRSQCGQQQQTDLYSPINNECSLFYALNQAGFQVQIGLNHNGEFDNFRQLIEYNLAAQATELVKYNEVSLGSVAFDGSEVGRDSEFLKKWVDRRSTMDAGPVALYYNTITLHDGNTLPNTKLSSLESYPLRLERLLNDIKNFIDYLKTRDRKALVLMVPEHGAGMSGEYGQLKGLRELPTPAITEAPVVAHWVSADYARRDIYKFPIQVSQPTSYAAVTEFMERWIGLPPPQRDDPTWPILTSDLPLTPFVAQQDRVTVIEHNHQHLLKAPGSNWVPLEEKSQ